MWNLVENGLKTLWKGISWFLRNGFMQITWYKPGKCHCCIIGDNDPSHKIILNNNEIASSSKKKLLGNLLDSKLNFDSRNTSFC